MKWLMSLFKKPEPEEVLNMAIENSDLSTVKQLLASGVNLQMKSRSGFTPLCSAAILGRETIVECLVKAGADLNARTTSGLTPLFYAEGIGNKGNRFRLMKYLISAGADINARRGTASNASKGMKDGCRLDSWALLHSAAFENKHETVEFLLNEGANADITNNDGNTPLHMAAMSGRVRSIRHLLAAGADKNIKNRKGMTALDYAKAFATMTGVEDAAQLIQGR